MSEIHLPAQTLIQAIPPSARIEVPLSQPRTRIPQGPFAVFGFPGRDERPSRNVGRAYPHIVQKIVLIAENSKGVRFLPRCTAEAPDTQRRAVRAPSQQFGKDSLPYHLELVRSPEEMRFCDRNRRNGLIGQIFVEPQPGEKRSTLANAALHHHAVDRRSDRSLPGCRKAQADPPCNLFSKFQRRRAPTHW